MIKQVARTIFSGQNKEFKTRLFFTLGGSLAAMALATPAYAGCAPDPATPFSTVTCSGADTDGFVADQDGVIVEVQSGATVGSLTATTNSMPPVLLTVNNIRINIAGEVTGGVLVTNSDPAPFPSAAQSQTIALITVAQGAAIRGTGILVDGKANTGFDPLGARASVYNAGLIESGISAGFDFASSLQLVQNDATGVIHGIVGPFLSIINRGSILGAGGSALHSDSPSFFPNPVSIQNSGLLQNDSRQATIRAVAFVQSSLSLQNSGMIENLGAGSALSVGFRNVVIENEVGGTIRSVGGTAISSNGISYTIVNRGTISGAGTAIATSRSSAVINYGTINGDVNLSDPVDNSITDNIYYAAGGTLNGNLILGNRNRLVVDLGPTGPLAGVTGNILPGRQSTLHYLVRQDRTATINAPVSFAATNYELLDGAKLILTGNPAANTSLGFSGVGSVDLTANISGDGSRPLLDLQALPVGPSLPPYTGVPTLLDFTSRGNLSVTSNGTGAQRRPAVVTSVGKFTNEGTISVRDLTIPTFGDPLMGIFGNGQITNNGIIEVGGAVGIGSGETGSGDSGLTVNNGTIRQISGAPDGIGLNTRFQMINNGTITTGGSAVVMGSQSGPPGTLTNNGLLRAANAPTVLSGISLAPTTITNSASGRIEAGGFGVAVRLGPSDTFENFGRITGGIDARDINRFGNTFRVFNLQFINSGTITGNVDLSSQTNASTFNVVKAKAGSVINGNLTLGGGGDTLIVDLGATGRLAGVAGTITAGEGSRLRYLVSSSQTANVPNVPSLFANWAFELTNNATLTLTGPVEANSSLAFAGVGRVESRLNITGNGPRSLLDFQVAPVGGGISEIAAANYGTLSTTHVDPATTGAPIVLTAHNFTNFGTINVRDNVIQADPLQQLVGIAGTGSIINKGTINVGGGYGIASLLQYGGIQIVNDGSIKQLGGAAAGTGILIQSSGTNAINNGSISVDGPAVRIGVEGDTDGGMLTNNGKLTSRRGATVVAGSIVNARLLNAKSGTITAGSSGIAIRFDGMGTIENQGTISGNVEMGVIAPLPGSEGNFFHNNGGTLHGNLLFGDNDDNLLLTGGKITGSSIDGGNGNDTLGFDTKGQRVSGFNLRSFKNFEILNILGGGEFSGANVPFFNEIHVSDTKFTIARDQTISAVNFSQSGGWLAVNGTLDSNLSPVGAIISGSGTINSPSLSAFSSIFVPGGAGQIGRLTVRGDVDLNDGTALMVDIGSADSDRFVVRSYADQFGLTAAGGLVIRDAALNLSRVNAGPRFGRTYTIVTADGGILGQFVSVQGSFGVLSPEVAYSANAVTLTFRAASLAAALPVGATPTELAFARALDQLRGSSFTSLSSLYGTIDLLEPGHLGLALHGLTPTAIGEAVSINKLQSGIISGLVSDRLSLLGTDGARRGTLTVVGSSLASLGGPDRLSRSVSTLGQASFASRITPGGSVIGQLPEHMSGFVSMGFDDGQSTLVDAAPGSQSGRRSWHMAMGIETAISDVTTLGTAFGYSEGVSHVFGAQSHVRTTQAVIYANHQLGGQAYVAGLASMAQSQIGLARRATVLDQVSELSGKANALSLDVQAESGITLDIAKGYRLVPRISLRYADTSYGTLRERGGETALRISNIRDQRLEGRIGAKLEGHLPVGGGWRLTQNLQADYVKKIAGQGGTMTIRFDAADSVAFALPFGTDDHSWTTAKGGLRIGKQQFSIGAGFESDIGRSDYRNSRAVVDLAWAF